ncbi:MAG: hypothetical protein HYR76_09435 [Ignavibacteria bacterium]|nr:hypothetical protein [Ignavibacteria bacterium]
MLLSIWFCFLFILTLDVPLYAQIPSPPQSTNEKYLAQYSPYEMTFDASKYSVRDKTLLKKLVEASEYLDTVYWLQTSTYGKNLRDSLARLQGDEQTAKLRTLLERNGGPFELLNEYVPFIGDRKYYAGEEFYPRGMTEQQFDAYVKGLSEADRTAFMSPYTVIREDGRGGYKAVPFHDEYKPYIEKIAKLVEECAYLADNESFANYLRLKAQALRSDQYFQSDVSWIDMQGSKFDIVFGPYETYADGIKGIKAKYEASIEVVDQEESKKLEIYTSYLQDMEENLPIPPEYKSEVKGLTAKFVIVRDIIRKGEAAVGYQAVATNLPNDPEVHAKKGTKKTFWKNMFTARFNTIIKPVSLRLIDPQQQRYLSDEGFFQVVLMHEICHAVGPRTVKVGPNKGMAANASIGPSYSPLEEEKADIAGLHSLALLLDKGVIDKKRENEFYISYLGSLFRSIRFGLNEAHGKAAAIELNYLTKQGAVIFNHEKKTWSIDFSKIRDGVKALASELLILEGNGDGKKVQEFFDRWTYMTPELQSSLDAVKDIAIDVLPHYSIQWE